MPFIFQLIVGSKQMHQTKLQQVRVDAWLSYTISGHGPDSHESNCASQSATCSKCLKPHKSSCASKVACAKCLKSHESSYASKVMHAKCLKPHESSCAYKVAPAKFLNLHESSCASLLVAQAKCLNSHESSCASKVVRAKCLNSHESSCASLLVARAKCLNSHESSCASLLAVHAKPLKSNKTQRMTPSLSLKFIGKSILEGALFVSATFQAFELIVA